MAAERLSAAAPAGGRGCSRPGAGARHRRRPQPAALRPRGAPSCRASTRPPTSWTRRGGPPAGCRSRCGCWSSRPSTCRWPTPASTRSWSPGRCAASPIRLAALREAHRVLVPGGALHFVEHGLSPSPALARWQQLADPGLAAASPAAAGSTGASTGCSPGPASRSSGWRPATCCPGRACSPIITWALRAGEPQGCQRRDGHRIVPAAWEMRTDAGSHGSGHADGLRLGSRSQRRARRGARARCGAARRLDRPAAGAVREPLFLQGPVGQAFRAGAADRGQPAGRPDEPARGRAGRRPAGQLLRARQQRLLQLRWR